MSAEEIDGDDPMIGRRRDAAKRGEFDRGDPPIGAHTVGCERDDGRMADQGYAMI